MPDMRAPSCRVAASQNHQSLKNVAGCMNALSQMFHFTRVVGGSKKFLATTDDQFSAQGMRKASCSHAAEEQSSRMKDQTRESEMGIDLRKLLASEQEPFVLQDIIWEKRHPMRTQSSRELKFEVSEVPRKSRSSKRVKSRDSKRAMEHQDENQLATSQGSEGKSSPSVMGAHIPAESMVALPSDQASPHHVRKNGSSSSKLASTGVSPGRLSSSRRVLLMEAATKILEGSNRSTEKVHSRAACFLLNEINRPSPVHGSFESKEVSCCDSSLAIDYSDKQKSSSPKHMEALERRRLEGKKQPCNSLDKSFSVGKLLGQNSSRSFTDSSDFSADDLVLSIMRSRIIHSGESSSAERSHRTKTANGYDVMLQGDNAVEPISQPSRRNSAREEKCYTEAKVANSCNIDGSDIGSADAQTHGDMNLDTATEMAQKSYSQPGLHARLEKREDLDLVTWVDSGTQLSKQELVNSQQWERPTLGLSQGGIAGHSDGFLTLDLDSSMVSASSVTSEISIADVDVRNACGIAGFVSEIVPAPLLLLCNFSWWTGERVQSDSPGTPVKNETTKDFTQYDSPTATTKVPCVVKLFEERKLAENIEEESSASPDHSDGEEFQQSSPVSVLDSVYENGPALSKPFDYFDETRRKLLESVRRYELLANMDLDTLIKINEENHFSEFEEESDASSLNELWGGYDADRSVSRVPLTGSPDYTLLRYDGGFPIVEEELLSSNSIFDPLHEATDDNLCTHSAEDLYLQHWQELADKDIVSASDLVMDLNARLTSEMDGGCKALLNHAYEPLDLHASTGPLCQSSSRDAFGEAEKLTGFGIVDAILQQDLKASRWSSFCEEVEVMKMELESSLYTSLMQELLSDLLH